MSSVFSKKEHKAEEKRREEEGQGTPAAALQNQELERTLRLQRLLQQAAAELPPGIFQKLREGAAAGRSPEQEAQLLTAVLDAHRAALHLKQRGVEPTPENLAAEGVSKETQQIIANALQIPGASTAAASAQSLPESLKGTPSFGAVSPHALLVPGSAEADPLFLRLVQNTPLLSDKERRRLWKQIQGVRLVARQLVSLGQNPTPEALAQAGVSLSKQRRLAVVLGIPLESVEGGRDAHEKSHWKITTAVLAALLLAAVAVGLWFRRKIRRSFKRMRHLYRDAYLRRLERHAKKKKKEEKTKVRVLRLSTGDRPPADGQRSSPKQHSETEPHGRGSTLVEKGFPANSEERKGPRQFSRVPSPVSQREDEAETAAPAKASSRHTASSGPKEAQRSRDLRGRSLLHAPSAFEESPQQSQSDDQGSFDANQGRRFR